MSPIRPLNKSTGPNPSPKEPWPKPVAFPSALEAPSATGGAGGQVGGLARGESGGVKVRDSRRPGRLRRRRRRARKRATRVRLGGRFWNGHYTCDSGEPWNGVRTTPFSLNTKTGPIIPKEPENL